MKVPAFQREVYESQTQHDISIVEHRLALSAFEAAFGTLRGLGHSGALGTKHLGHGKQGAKGIEALESSSSSAASLAVQKGGVTPGVT